MTRRSGGIVLWCVALATAFLAFGCASAPEPDPDSTILWGYVRLAPKEGSQASEGGYGDRRVADAKRVDYSRAKYAVVFAPSARGKTSPLAADLVIRSWKTGARFDPPFASTSPSAGIRITNATASPQIVSVPSAARLERIQAGESVVVGDLPSGEISVHLLGFYDKEIPSPTQIWVTEGLTAVVEPSGRYTLRDLDPGPHEIRAWHPRLPPSPARAVVLDRGAVVRLDVEIGLDAGRPDFEKVR